MKKEPRMMRGKKNIQFEEFPSASLVCRGKATNMFTTFHADTFHSFHSNSLTAYIICVHPSIVTTWNVVSTAKPMLSNVLMPAFGPCFEF